MNNRPKLRPVEAFPVTQDGKTMIYLKDPLNLASPIGLSPVGYFLLMHLDGQHSLVDLQAAYSRQFGSLLLSDELNSFLEMLDEHHYLVTDRFADYQKRVLEEFRRIPTRAPAHVGGVYKAEPGELQRQLDEYFTAAKGPGVPAQDVSAKTPKGIVAPHIDFHRGGPGYAWAYKALAESDGADLYIVLGTSHCGGSHPF